MRDDDRWTIVTQHGRLRANDESGDDSVQAPHHLAGPPGTAAIYRLAAEPRLTPEEDAIGDPEDEDEADIDPTLPSDLWFRSGEAGGLRCPRMVTHPTLAAFPA